MRLRELTDTVLFPIRLFSHRPSLPSEVLESTTHRLNEFPSSLFLEGWGFHSTLLLFFSPIFPAATRQPAVLSTPIAYHL